MKAIAYGVTVHGSLVIGSMHLDEDTAFKAAHQIHYDRFHKDPVSLVRCKIDYETIKQISQPKKLKKRKKLRKRMMQGD